MPSCAAIVFGRTYEVDFRFITVPENFTKEDEDWAWGYIKAVMRSAEKLPAKPRWSLFANSRFCVVGLVCMVSDLIDRDSSASDNVTKDFKNRPLHVFVGYVTDKRKGMPEIPQYSANNIQIFKPLYDYVRDQWSFKSFQAASKVPAKSDYQELNIYPSQTYTAFNSEFLSLNLDEQEAVVWPDSEENRIVLWNMSSQSIISQNKSLSVCLGLGNQRDIVDCKFLNGTSIETTQKTTIQRFANPSFEVIPEEPSRKKASSKAANTVESDMDFGFTEAIGALVGATLFSKVAGMGVGIIIGSAFGWIAAGVLTKRGIGGTLDKQVSKLFKYGNRQEETRYSREQKSRDRSSRKQSNDQSTASNYGFKQKTDRKSGSRQPEDTEDSNSGWF